ncbi:mucin-16-like [Petaurus breviceps papuanus]|uniref:mucin-16-like n=1 Tax=Petaurus breviceps papuanus TaxID=3040969 RepID=UPI0036DF378D
MTSTVMTGAQISPAEPSSSPAEPPEPTPPEGVTPCVAPMIILRTRDGGELQSSLASTSTLVWETSRPGSPAASDTIKLFLEKFLSVESMANLWEGLAQIQVAYKASYHTLAASSISLHSFTMNFTITNLLYTTDMAETGSYKFNATESVLRNLLNHLFQKTSIGSHYSGCKLTSLGSALNGTAVNVLCMYWKSSTLLSLDERKMYWTISKHTHAITRLGPYALDEKSLFVNGYNYQMSLSTSTSLGDLSSECFTLNFTIANLTYTADMYQKGSSQFNSTESTLKHLLNSLFGKTSIGPFYSGCKLILLSPLKGGTATRVIFACSCRLDSENSFLDREKLYWELSDQTWNITRLGPYILDDKSLFVNDYNHLAFASTKTPMESSLQPFIVNFTITNLRYAAEMGLQNSVKFNITDTVMQHLFTNSTDLDAKQVFHELSNQTHGIRQLGHYSLDKDSLFIDGLGHSRQEAQSLSSFVSSNSRYSLGLFTLNFTITNLRCLEDMNYPGTGIFNSTERMLQLLLNPLFKESSISSSYVGCKTIALRCLRGGSETGVNSVCTHRGGPTNPSLDKEKLYWELSDQTDGLTRLGPYILERKSFYLGVPQGSGMGFLSVSSVTAGGYNLQMFTLNFTITNLVCPEDMHLPGTGIFNSTERILQRVLTPLFKRSSISSSYVGCRLTALRCVTGGSATGVDAVCTHGGGPNSPSLDKEKLYWELRNQTHGMTRLGPYTLDQGNFYLEAGGHYDKPFTLNFTITNVLYIKDMDEPGSHIFNSMERMLQRVLNQLFKGSSIHSSYGGCKIIALRSMKEGSATGVDAVCTNRGGPTHPSLDKENLYWELSKPTDGFTRLGPYRMDNESFYLDAGGHSMESFTLNFTIDNMSYKEDKAQPESVYFRYTDNTFQQLLSPLFMKSSIASFYSGCKLTSLRPMKGGSATRVDVVCTCWKDPARPFLDIKKLYLELSHQTYGITRLGPYRLDRESLYINAVKIKPTHWMTELGSQSIDQNVESEDWEEESASGSATGSAFTYSMGSTGSGTSTECSLQLGYSGFSVLLPTEVMLAHQPFQGHYQLFPGHLRHMFNHIYTQNNPIKFVSTDFVDVHVTFHIFSPRPMKNGFATGVNFLCTHHIVPANPVLEREKIYREFSGETHGITILGPYHLDKNSLYLDGELRYNEHRMIKPSAASDHSLEAFTLNFTITNLLYAAEMEHPDSREFISTDRNLQDLLGPLFRNNIIGSSYLGCKLISLRLMKDGLATGVDVLCTYWEDPNRPVLDREKAYWNLRNQTCDFSILGPYSLDQDSLYINATNYSMEAFTLNFTITNLPYVADMGNTGSNQFNTIEKILQHLSTPGQGEYQFHFKILNHDLTNPDPTSPEYKALQKDIQDKMTQLYLGSQLQDRFRYCLVTGLSPIILVHRMGSVWVTCNCSFSSNLDPNTIGQVFLDRTWNATTHWLGNFYKLDNIQVTKLELAFPLSTAKPLIDPRSQNFRLNFTITSLLYSEDLTRPDSAKYKENKNSIEDELNHLFRNSSMKNYFSDCQVQTFRPVSPGSHTGVDSLCKFTSTSPAQSFDKAAVYEEFLRLTSNGTKLKDFTLDQDSVLVDEYPANKIDGSKKSGMPFWGIILICLGMFLGLMASLVICFMVTTCLRKKKEDYKVQRQTIGSYLSHLDLRKIH